MTNKVSYLDQFLTLNQDAAVRMLNKLRCGIVPSENLRLLTVGRNEILKSFLEGIQGAIKGQQCSLLLEGAYGEGKSHLLTLAEEIALNNRVAVSRVTIDPHSGISFNIPKMLFRNIAARLHGCGNSAEIAEILGNVRKSFDEEHLEVHLQSLIETCRLQGSRALMVLFDEVESTYYGIPRIDSREKAYRIMNMLMDAGLKHVFVVFATTPGLFQMIASDISHDSIKEASKELLQTWSHSPPPTVRLAPLTLKHLFGLADRIALLHARAYNWQPFRVVSRENLQKKLVNMYQKSHRIPERSLIRQFVRMMDLLQQNYTSKAIHEFRPAPVQLTAIQAKQSLESLKNCQPPMVGLEEMTLSWEHLIAGQQEYFRFTRDNGDSTFRFACGASGMGLSHYLQLTQELALRDGFAVCMLDANEINLARFDTFYKALTSSLAVDDPEPPPLNLPKLFKRHLPDEDSRQQLLQALDDLDLDDNYCQALKHYLTAKTKKDRKKAMYWLKGGQAKLDDVDGYIDKRLSKGAMRSLINLLRYLGYGGLIILIDDLNALRNLPPVTRMHSYQTMRILLDNSDHLRHCHFVASTTPDIFIAPDGFREYKALFDRVKDYRLGSQESMVVDARDVLIRLEQKPWQENDYHYLLKYIIRLYKTAENLDNWDIPESLQNKFIQDVIVRPAIPITRRRFVLSTIKFVDLVYQRTRQMRVSA